MPEKEDKAEIRKTLRALLKLERVCLKNLRSAKDEMEKGFRATLKVMRANHKGMVERNALLRQRHDMPVDRLPAHEELVRLQEENARLRKELEGK